MKNYKVFSLLAMTVLLTACPGTKPHLEVSEPKFAPLGEEITAQQYSDGMLAGFNALDFANRTDDTVLGSKRGICVRSSDVKTDARVNGTQTNNHSISRFESSGVFDSETKVGLMSEDNKSYRKAKEVDGTKIDDETHNDKSFYFEKVRIANADYYAKVYPQEQLVKTSDGDLIDETYTEELMFSYYNYMSLIVLTDYLELRATAKKFPTLDAEVLANYKFYKNGNTYTSVFNKDEEGKNDTQTKQQKVSQSEKIQVSFTEYGYDYLASAYLEKEIKYLKDDAFDIRKKGDYENTIGKGYIDCKFEESPTDVHVEAVDYEGYTAEVEILYY